MNINNNNKILNMVETKAGLCTGGMHLEGTGREILQSQDRIYIIKT